MKNSLRFDLENLTLPQRLRLPLILGLQRGPLMLVFLQDDGIMPESKCAQSSSNRKDTNGTKESEEKKEEEDGARRLSRPERVLDYADAVLAMGQRRRHRQNGRQAIDRSFPARA